MNPDKCKLVITKCDQDISVSIDVNITDASKYLILLGIKIDNNLDYNELVSSICNKVNLKLHALARISQFMEKEKLRLLMEVFIGFQFGYCPMIWMYHSRTINNGINKLHERALRLVYKYFVSSIEELLLKDFTIHHRNLQKLGTERYKERTIYHLFL